MDQDSFCQELFVENGNLVIKLNPAFQSRTTGMNSPFAIDGHGEEEWNRSLISRF